MAASFRAPSLCPSELFPSSCSPDFRQPAAGGVKRRSFSVKSAKSRREMAMGGSEASGKFFLSRFALLSIQKVGYFAMI